jgi:hypothetical protein
VFIQKSVLSRHVRQLTLCVLAGTEMLAVVSYRLKRTPGAGQDARIPEAARAIYDS